MKDSEKGILLVIAGIAVLALSIIYIAKPKYENIQALKAESEQLQIRLNDLQSKQARRDEYLAGIDEFNKAFEEVMEGFPADLNQEVTIMFLQGIKDNNEFDIASLGLGRKEEFYTLGLGGGDATLATPAPAADTTDEAATDEAAAATDTTASDGLAEGPAVPSSSTYTCYRAAFPITYSGAYESLKDVIRYVNNFENRMTINAINIAYAADNDSYSGTLDLRCYSIESADRPETKMELNEVEIGVDNIFLGGEGSGSSSSDSSLNKYDENDGASIESNYDFYAMLNAATSDVSAKVVGQNGAGKEASVISNSDNSVSTLSFEFYEQNGKNYCKYTLDGSTSYEAEVTSAEDIKLLIQSSARKDSDDDVSIRLTIKNSSSLPVYVKISNDDATSPRVKITSKTGAVKVY